MKESIFDLEVKGEVYNLTMLRDFPGTYRRLWVISAPSGALIR